MGLSNGNAKVNGGQTPAVDPADDDFDEPDVMVASGAAMPVTPTPDPIQNEGEVSQQRQQRLERRRQQSAVVATEDRLTEALEGKPESFKNHVYELMMEYKLDRDDPSAHDVDHDGQVGTVAPGAS